MNRLKLLISAYACSPNRGSEPGMGWNFVKGLSAFHELHVIVEKRKWETSINEFLTIHPEMKGNLKFYFIEKNRNKLLRKIWPPSYYWYYKKWQKKALKLAVKLDTKENFDIIHQLNMVGYREPGYLWKINKPFVWGPIGGLENSPWSFLFRLELKALIFYCARNLINSYQRRFSSRPKKAANHRNSVLIAATPRNSELIKRYWNKESEFIGEVGRTNIPDVNINNRDKTSPLKIVWSGQHTSGKNLPLLLNALSKVNIDYELHILGKGKMTNNWRNKAKKLKVDNNCIWYGWVEQKKAIDIMKSGHVFCITSIKDLTSTVLLEALSFGLPVITLDHCGFSHVVNQSCGIKIPVISPKQAKKDFVKAIETLYNDEALRQDLSRGAIKRSEKFSWATKIEKLNRIYDSLLEK